MQIAELQKSIQALKMAYNLIRIELRSRGKATVDTGLTLNKPTLDLVRLIIWTRDSFMSM